MPHSCPAMSSNRSCLTKEYRFFRRHFPQVIEINPSSSPNIAHPFFTTRYWPVTRSASRTREPRPVLFQHLQRLSQWRHRYCFHPDRPARRGAHSPRIACKRPGDRRQRSLRPSRLRDHGITIVNGWAALCLRDKRASIDTGGDSVARPASRWLALPVE